MVGRADGCRDSGHVDNDRHGEGPLALVTTPGQDRIVVRPFDTSDRLLWIVALAHAPVVLALRNGKLTHLRDQAIRLLMRQAVLGCRLSGGKLAEAIELEFSSHRGAALGRSMVALISWK